MWQELVEDHPFVMPHSQSMGLEVGLFVGDRGVVRSNQGHGMVVKQQKRRVQAGDHHILIIAGVTDNRHVINRVPWQVLELHAAFDSEFDWSSRIVYLRVTDWSAGINGIQVKEASASVLRNNRLRRESETRPLIKRHVVVKEMSEKSYT